MHLNCVGRMCNVQAMPRPSMFRRELRMRISSSEESSRSFSWSCGKRPGLHRVGTKSVPASRTLSPKSSVQVMLRALLGDRVGRSNEDIGQETGLRGRDVGEPAAHLESGRGEMYNESKCWIASLMSRLTGKMVGFIVAGCLKSTNSRILARFEKMV
jgi:hypothetical protein